MHRKIARVVFYLNIHGDRDIYINRQSAKAEKGSFKANPVTLYSRDLTYCREYSPYINFYRATLC